MKDECHFNCMRERQLEILSVRHTAYSSTEQLKADKKKGLKTSMLIISSDPAKIRRLHCLKLKLQNSQSTVICLEVRVKKKSTLLVSEFWKWL